MRQSRLVVPNFLEDKIVALAHIGHQGIVKCKQFLRERVWFKGMDKKVEDMVKGCMSCQLVTPVPAATPLKMSTIPDRVWDTVAMDFKGPVGNGKYILVAPKDFRNEIMFNTKVIIFALMCVCFLTPVMVSNNYSRYDTILLSVKTNSLYSSFR